MPESINADLTAGEMSIFELARYFGLPTVDADVKNTWHRRLSSNPTNFAWLTDRMEIGYRLNPDHEIRVHEAMLHEIAHLIIGTEDIEDEDEMKSGVYAVEYALSFALTNGDAVRQEIFDVAEATPTNMSWAKGVLEAFRRGFIEEEGYPTEVLCRGKFACDAAFHAGALSQGFGANPYRDEDLREAFEAGARSYIETELESGASL